MACSEDLAVAVVFGKTEFGDRRYKTQSVFNKLDWPKDNVNVLMPAVETDWPDDSTLTQILIFVVGAPGDVAQRASGWVDTVPGPAISLEKPAYGTGQKSLTVRTHSRSLPD